ncbi:MAG TPA: hypothetical protein DDW52_26710 [Planctomycetaceae bacterium]|nr:hypothetical protein [Planctomycetaceae bacterium]
MASVAADMTIRAHSQSGMHFCGEELELAQLFKAYGIDWQPSVGMYVLDQSELIEVPSPFQDRVYFILDLKHFLRRSGSLGELKERVCWLPTYEQARTFLFEAGVPHRAVAKRLSNAGAIDSGNERLELYRMIEDHLSGQLEAE